jgi:hypothetical protein
VSTKLVFAEYPSRYSMDLVELGARIHVFGGSGVFGAEVFGRKNLEWSFFFESRAAWSPAKHALS